MNWWNKSVFYQIYPRTFNQDLNGITDKLSYLQELGVDALWISPFYPHSNADGGYDVKDYFDVSQEFGDMKDLKNLINIAHEKNMKVVIDLVINHASTAHEWFEKSKKKIKPYDEYFIWGDEPGNNWESFFGGSAWEYSLERKQYYYSSFSKEQADLNWSNEAVFEEFRNIIQKWLDFGIDGFRFDVINNLTFDTKIGNNPVVNNEQIHINDVNQKQVKQTLRALFKDIPQDKVLIGEISSNNPYVINDYLDDGLFDLAFSFNLLEVDSFLSKELAYELKDMMISLSGIDKKPTLVFSSHDTSRIYNRLANSNLNFAKQIAFFLLNAYGVPFIFQGDELATENMKIKNIEDIKDIQGIIAYHEALKTLNEEEAFEIAKSKTRDYSRLNINFNNYKNNEMFNYYQELIQIRKQLKLENKDYKSINFNDTFLWYERGKYLFVMNISDTKQKFKMKYQTFYSSHNNQTNLFEEYESKIMEVNNEHSKDV